jgi:hypothetical protein
MPQFAGSCCVRVQVPLQLVLIWPHWQALLTQLPSGPHATPHMPQFASSLVGLMHWPLHRTKPAGQAFWHEPLTQVCPELQVTPQPPQFIGSELSSTHLPPQLVWPIGQEQALDTHDAFA